MSEREKVIKGLECSIGIRGRKNCDDCPYDNDFNCIGCDIVLRDAIALLKEQEPRVLTIEEVKAYPTDKALWFEGWMIAPVLPDCRVEQQNEDKLGVEVVDRLYDFPLWYDSYNVDFKYGWRCWSARPTEEQREAVPWDD